MTEPNSQNHIIFCDFDGVIRHWNNADLFTYEVEQNLQKGVTFQHAFRPNVLLPAITGAIKDEIWRDQVLKSLTADVGANVARQLIDHWNSSSYSIDLQLINYFSEELPRFKLALVTNGTTKLNRDLDEAGLTNRFGFVINSADIGIAKPNLNYYKKAVEITNANINRSIFIDDSEKNVNAAGQTGLAAFYFQGATKLKKEIQKWLEMTK